VRLYSTLVLMVSFAAIIYAGHVPLMGLIFSIQTVMVKELFQLAREAQQERKLPGFRAQQWYFYFVAAFWVYVRFVKNNLIVEMSGSVMLVRLLGTLVRRHTMVSYTLYACGFGWFVLGLEKGSYTYQFGQFAWTHMILMTVFLPSSFFVSNIFEGIIWFLLPTSLVIVNDIAAYLAGFFFGRTPLIKLSPKKTWEGFIGGTLCRRNRGWRLVGGTRIVSHIVSHTHIACSRRTPPYQQAFSGQSWRRGTCRDGCQSRRGSRVLATTCPSGSRWSAQSRPRRSSPENLHRSTS